VCRPDLAVRPIVMRMLMGLREEELFNVAGRSGVRMPADQRAMEHVHARLAATLGTGWSHAMRLDPVAITSDCVVETFSAVLRKDVLAETQVARKIPADSLLTLLMARLPGPCKRRRRGTDNIQTAPIAEAADARRAVVRVRRKGVAEAATVDLRLVRWLLAVLGYMGLSGPRALALFEDFAAFVTNQLDLRNEAHMLRLCHAARVHKNDARLTFPRLYGEAGAEVLIVSFEDGVCMAEVLRRRQAPTADEDEGLARVVVAGEMVRAFWTASLGHGLVLGDLSASNLLLRSAGSGNDLEVMSLRCGLAHEIDERMQEDLRAFVACLDEGPLEMVGPLILERVHLPAGGSLGSVRDPDAFASGIRELLSRGRRSCAASPLNASETPLPPLRGTALLQSALALAQKHGVCVGPRHLRLAAALAAVHSVCARLDPVAAGQPLREMQAVAASVSSTGVRPTSAR